MLPEAEFKAAVLGKGVDQARLDLLCLQTTVKTFMDEPHSIWVQIYTLPYLWRISWRIPKVERNIRLYEELHQDAQQKVQNIQEHIEQGRKLLHRYWIIENALEQKA
ncbi:MAG: hypothetical protein V4457_04525 [Pseudomonadota bacterium]